MMTLAFLGDYALSFGQPLALSLFAFLPLAVAVALRGVSRSARRRRLVAIALRLIILTALVLSLAGARISQVSDQVAVVFLVDVSDSLGSDGRVESEALIREALATMPDGDQAAIVLFGGDAIVERAMSDLRTVEPLRSQPITTATDIAGAVRLGLALFPDGAARRLVLISDGEENRGDLESAAMLASANNAQIATVRLERPTGADVLVAELNAPPQARAGDSISVTVRVESTTTTEATLRLTGDGAVLTERTVGLAAGTNQFTLTVNVGDRGFRVFTATVSAPDGSDTVPENNQLSAFTDVAGPASVLLLEGAPGEAASLAAALSAGGIQTETRAGSAAPGNLPELAGYDAVVLVNVPALDLGRKMDTLQSYVRDLGRGLVVIGGDNSYALGGYFNTTLEETLPVRMDIRDPQRLPQVSVDFVLDKSGSMGRCHGEGTSRARIESGLPKTDLAKESTWRAIQLLGPSDEVGVVVFDDAADRLAEVRPVSEQGDLASVLAGIEPGGGTNIYAGLDSAVTALEQSNGRVKHIILITDGWSNTGDFDALLVRMRDSGITLSIIGAGGGAADFLGNLAERGGGRFYAVADPHDIPEVFLKETKTAMRAYIVEGEMTLKLGAPSPILAGVDGLPTLFGYVATTPKATAQTPLVSPNGEPVLAHWQYGLGRSVAWTSDAKSQWAANWVGWDSFAQFWTQVIRWAAAPPGDPLEIMTGTVGAAPGGGTSVTVDAVSPAGEFRDGLLTDVAILGPDGTRTETRLQQTAPGRYEGNLAELPPGAYLITATQRDAVDGSPLSIGTSGVIVGYPAEYRPVTDGAAKLERALQLTGGAELAAGSMSEAFVKDLPPVPVERALWPLLVLIALLLLPIDVATRRLNLSRQEVAQGWQWAIRRRTLVPATDIPTPAGAGAGSSASALLTPNRRATRLGQQAARGSPTPTTASTTSAPEPKTTAATTESSTPRPEAPQPATTAGLLAAKRRAATRSGKPPPP